MNMTVTNVDIGSVILKDAQFRDANLFFAANATILSGTILARRAVDATVTVTAGANTGDGTVTLAQPSDGPVVPRVGNYVLRCTTAVANGGIFRLEDPDGAIVATGLAMTAGAGNATIIEAAGLRFTITDAATDFIVGDSFTLAVAADGNMVPYSPTGVGGAQVPLAVLTYDVTGEEDDVVPIRQMVSGQVRKNRLIIAADGDGDNITEAMLDQLRDYGLVAIDVDELNILDNQ